MEMKRKVAIRTRDALILNKISVGNKRILIEAAMFKIAVLYNLAKQQNIYAYIRLMKTHNTIEELLGNIRANIKKSKKLIKKRIKSLPDIELPVQEQKQLGFSNPIHFGLIQLLQDYDDYISWLLLARNSNVFVHQNRFYELKNKIRKQVFRLLSEIIRIDTKALPHINLRSFFENDEFYQRAVVSHGKVDPQELYNAIHSAVTPSLNPEELNKATTQLKNIVTKK